MTPAEIKAIKDPEKQAREAQAFITRGSDAITDIRQIRDAAILRWQANGATQRTIAAELGLTPGLIGQIAARVKR